MSGWHRVANSCTCCAVDPEECECSIPLTTSLPVSCSAFTTYDVSANCYTGSGDCGTMSVSVTGAIDTHWGCPWCDDDCCGGEACEGDEVAVGGTFDAGGGCSQCWDCLDDDGWHSEPVLPWCPEGGYSTQLGHESGSGCSPPAPQSMSVDATDIFTAFSVSYNAGSAGADITDDLCAVYGAASAAGCYFDYVYTTGVCKRYSLTTLPLRSAGDHIDCINAQSTGASAGRLGLVATGTSANILQSASNGFPSHPYTRLDDGGGTVSVRSYKPNKVYFTWSCAIGVDPVPCENQEGNAEYNFTLQSDTMQRLTTTQPWTDFANCPVNYSFSVTSLGDGIVSLSVSFS